jgi:decaprenylphospho-beta-D-erythro-pentofuranosid-2-ulose 2-reductase
MKRIIIIGATSSIAQNCARIWLRDEDVDLTLVGRCAIRVERVAADLGVRSPNSKIRVIQADFIDSNSIKKTVDDIVSDGYVDIVLIAQGFLPEQAECQKDLQACQFALTVNGISPVLFAEAFAGYMESRNHGTLAIIGSVAGDRGRRSNYIYGSAKELISRYAEGLQNRLSETRVKVVMIKPGPTDTPMTAQIKERRAMLASVESVSQKIVDAVNHGKALVYVPRKWGIIMFIIRSLPHFIFKKLNI